LLAAHGSAVVFKLSGSVSAGPIAAAVSPTEQQREEQRHP